MKTMTEAEFIILIQSPDLWSIETTGDGEVNRNDDPFDDATATCWAWGCVEARHDGIEITYQETASWAETHPEEYETTTDHGADVLTVTGVTVVDDDGDDLPSYKISEMFGAHADRAFSDVDWPALLPEKKYQYADEDTEMTNDMITLPRDKGLDLRFSGELIAEASSSANNASSQYSGQTGRWTTLRLYRTAGGKFVCQSIGHTIWEGEHNRYSAAVCATDGEVIEFFGTGWLAKSLYGDAGIEAVETVE